jgi:peptidoglycan/xylan/chitin deacetylase (PgdA/CDA1 family)
MTNGQRSLSATLKVVLLRPLELPGVAKVLSSLTDTQATIFMCHRFSVPQLGIVGHDATALRRCLAHLRKRRYSFLPLEEVFRKLHDGIPLKRAIAFTIDDGYFDHGQIAAPIFAEFDCPVTTFVATGYIDGKTWYWWDKLEYIFERTKRTELPARLGDGQIVYRLDSLGARSDGSKDLSRRCQDASEADRLACILETSCEAEVELPGKPPARFAPLSWDAARSLEKGGMTFGPHTVTHPVLSTTSDEQAEFEMTESWRRLSAEVARPVPVFCYPSGRAKDFGEREMGIVRRMGLLGAVSGQPGELHPTKFQESPTLPYRVPRFGYSDSLPHVLQCVSGLETLKSRLRGASA